MPKQPVTTPRKLIRALQKLGFFHSRQRGSHLVMEHADGRTVVIPMHSRDIPTDTLSGIIKDVGISKEEFILLLKK